MPSRRFTPALAFLLALVIGCDDDSTTAPEEGDPPFARALGGQIADVTATDVMVLSDGSRVVSGFFSGVMHITGDPDSLSSSTAPAGYLDVFLVSFRPDGSVAWKRAIPGSGVEICHGMARDADDNLYIGGRYSDHSVFGGTNLTNNGLTDALVAGLDSEGNLLWAAGGGDVGYDVVYDIAATADGEVFACGVASGEISLAGEDFGELGSESGFLVNIRSSGVGRWAATAGGPQDEMCMAVVTTGDGHVLMSGQYDGDVDVAGVVLPGDGNDSFIARYTVGGDPAGVIRIGGAGSSIISEITQIDGGAVVTGLVNGTEDFNVTASGGEVTASSEDIFVARYDADGAFRWVRRFGGSGNDIGLDVCRIGTSDILVGGSFAGTIQLGSSTFTAIDLTDFFLVRLDPGGNVKEAFHMGGQGYDHRLILRATGESMTLVGKTEAPELLLPNGSTLQTRGDSFIYHQP